MKAFQAGQCTEVNISSTSLVQCGGTLYERDAFFGALVSFDLQICKLGTSESESTGRVRCVHVLTSPLLQQTLLHDDIDARQHVQKGTCNMHCPQ